jgi:hypothetical protein
MNIKTLDELANHFDSDKSTKSSHKSTHGYAPIYDKLLNKWKNESISLLEIGVCMEDTLGGQSVKMWEAYFEKAKIYTFDIVDMSKLKNNRVNFFRGDQSKRIDFENMIKAFNISSFDFILEDGSHKHEHQMISLASLFKYVKSGGYYILEDISVAGRPCCCIRNDQTFETIQNFIKTNKFENPHITKEEQKYIEDNISDIKIHDDIQNAYCVAIFTKK